MAYVPPPRRPIGVAILAILVILAGAFLTFIALILVFFSSILIVGGIPGGGLVVAGSFIFLILSLVLLASGIGLWGLRPWAWWLATIVTVLVLLNYGLNWYSIGYPTQFAFLLPIVIPAIILLYLFAVRGSFQSQPAYAPPPPR